jgi:hypothetical protein
MDASTEALFTKGTPLEQLFRHDPPIEILTNLRGKNTKVVSYFCRSATILQLFALLLAERPSLEVIVPVKEGDDADKENKGSDEKMNASTSPSLLPKKVLPSVIDVWKENTLLACSILTSDVESFLDMVVRLEFLDVLFGILKHEEPLDCVTASSFCRVVEFLFQIRTNNMFDYMKKREQLLPGITHHLDSDSIFKLLTFIIKLSVDRDADKPKLETLQWLSLASLLVNQLLTAEESFSSELFANTVNFVIHLLDTYSMEQFAPFMSQLQNENLVRKIVEKALVRYKDPGTCVGCVRLLIKLLDSHKTGDQRAVIADQLTHLYQDYMGEMQAYTRQPPAIVFELINQSNVILVILTTGNNPSQTPEGEPKSATTNNQHLFNYLTNGLTNGNGNGNGGDSVQDYLLNSKPRDETTPPSFPTHLGTLRYTLVQLVGSVLRTNYWVVDSYLRDSELLWTCIDLFFHYRNNSLLHDEVTLMMRELFLKQTHKDLSVTTVTDYRLHEKIMTEFKKKEEMENDSTIVGNNPNMPHYMGHLVQIANFITECSATKRWLSLNKRWQNFVNDTLRRINEIHKPVKPAIKDTCVRQSRRDERKESDVSVWELFDEEFW